ncbi:YjjG family noncanonical pyrimidine nucleotidase [Xanthovirga aplysinae]|uniref:YjjG family noncanonical pyrimidine nucleotidase n=1 Tax=Xanthovirga aplysinae TaxID=2529853 RepID=UPI0012BC1F30|nr:YjjG family noncanonical pyrimidine nucleotidase [Xanthovirga aplysinae]MTI30526.1 noncanonical pyrimidine nucleotidase, YjjG family [Xanthovirga aplysinae]
MTAYKHLFFDLDHTLWDYDRNATEVLRFLFDKYNLQEKSGSSVEAFLEIYQQINEQYWIRFEEGQIGKEEIREERFPLTFKNLGINSLKGLEDFGEEFLNLTPHKTNLIPYAREVLEVLKDKFHLHIITNGFQDVQLPKLEGSQLRSYFRKIITSDCGFNKPDPRIFLYAMEKAGCEPSEALMIGDNLQADVFGAQRMQIDQVYFNPIKEKHGLEKNPTFEVTCLSDIPSLLM